MPYAVSRNLPFRGPEFVNGIVLSTLRELASSGAIRAYTLTGQAGGYTLTARYGMAEQTLIAKRGEPRLFAKIETAFELLRSFEVPRVEVIIAGYEAKPRAYRRGRPGALKALAGLQRQAKPAAAGAKTPARKVAPSKKAQLKLPGLPPARRNRA